MIPIPRVDGGYRTIYADPPWRYRQVLGRGKGGGDTTRGGLPYASMSEDEIRALPIGEVAAVDAQLWLWTTNNHIHSALHIIEAWGFEYVTKVTWDKARIGLGYWLRGQTEDLLFAIRGSPRGKMIGPNGATGKAWSTLVRAPRSKHSRKPALFYGMIEDMGEVPRLELFARGRRDGWTSWGDEVPPETQETLEE